MKKIDVKLEKLSKSIEELDVQGNYKLRLILNLILILLEDIIEILKNGGLYEEQE